MPAIGFSGLFMSLYLTCRSNGTKFSKYDLSSLKIITYGTEPMPEYTLKSILKNKLGYNTTPVALSALNDETKFVLNYFNVDEPPLKT